MTRAVSLLKNWIGKHDIETPGRRSSAGENRRKFADEGGISWTINRFNTNPVK